MSAIPASDMEARDAATFAALYRSEQRRANELEALLGQTEDTYSELLRGMARRVGEQRDKHARWVKCRNEIQQHMREEAERARAELASTIEDWGRNDEQVLAENQRLADGLAAATALADELLAMFATGEKGHPGRSCVRTGWIDETAIAELRGRRAALNTSFTEAKAPEPASKHEADMPDDGGIPWHERHDAVMAERDDWRQTCEEAEARNCQLLMLITDLFGDFRDAVTRYSELVDETPEHVLDLMNYWATQRDREQQDAAQAARNEATSEATFVPAIAPGKMPPSISEQLADADEEDAIGQINEVRTWLAQQGFMVDKDAPLIRDVRVAVEQSSPSFRQDGAGRG